MIFQTPKVSIVIASHRINLISACLDSLSSQIDETPPFEIIVVSDYSSDHLNKTYPHVKWIFEDNLSISVKRNTGVKNSSGEIIAFVDDDCRPHNDWITDGVTFLETHPEIAAIEGRTMIERNVNTTGAYGDYKRLESQGFRTNNIFYRKRVIDESGGFDERFTVQREDVDLAFSAMEKGFNFGYCEKVGVIHIFRSWEKWDLLKNCRNRRFDPLLFRKHPRLYRKYINSPFPGSLSFLLFLHAACALCAFINLQSVIFAVAIDLTFVVFLTVKRIGMNVFTIRRFPRVVVEVIAAPIVLAAALIYGSIKFKKWLLF